MVEEFALFRQFDEQDRRKREEAADEKKRSVELEKAPAVKGCLDDAWKEILSVAKKLCEELKQRYPRDPGRRCQSVSSAASLQLSGNAWSVTAQLHDLTISIEVHGAGFYTRMGFYTLHGEQFQTGSLNPQRVAADLVTTVFNPLHLSSFWWYRRPDPPSGPHLQP